MLRSFARSFSSTVVKRDFARTQLLGTVGNFEFRESENGTKYVTYSLAVNRYNKETQEQVTNWYRITAFNQLERLEKSLRVGNVLHVDANLAVRKSEDPETHKVRSELQLIQKNFDVARFGKKDVEETSP